MRPRDHAETRAAQGSVAVMSEKSPPLDVQEEADKVNRWLGEQANARLSEAEIARLTPAQRLDYVRQFDQRSMPAWQDPRRG
jgi:hypothetical protein